MDATQNLRQGAVIAVFLLVFGGHQVAHAWLGGSQDEAARSAAQILNTGWSVGDNVYWIDPNGGDTGDAFQVFCDMTAAGGGWMLVVNSIAGAEPPTNDMASNTGTAHPASAHTRDMSFWAIEQSAEIRHEIVGGMLFHAKYTGRYHDAMPNFTGWTTLSGHEAGSETMISYHFGWLWSTATDDNDGSAGNCAATYGAPWYYNDCWSILPSRPDNGLAQGPERNGVGVIARYSIYVRELSTPSLTVSSNGTGGGDFGDPCTWAGGIVPGPVDTTVIVSGDTVTLDSDFTVAGLSIEAGAIFDEATSSMTIVESGTLVNNGIIRVSRPILGTGPVEFGLSDVNMNIAVQGTLSLIEVDRIDSNHPQAYGSLLSGIYWSITPTGSDYTLGLTLPHNISPDSNAHLARHEGGVIWTLGRSSSTATHVTLEGVTQLSDWTVCTGPTGPSTIYVDADALAGGNGQSWATAYKYLQDALAVAMADDQIWVAEGTYKPDASTANPVGTSERAATFQLINGVGIYGGYAGYWAADPNERDVELYETILSGDINTPGDNSDNSYHVVTAIGADANAVLDGFTVTAGNASGSWPSLTALGGGMLNMSNSSHRVTNCTFSRNCAESGSGMWNDFSSPTVSNCTFSRNSARANGGGMFNWGSNSTVINCTFSGNSAYSGAGMLNNVASSPTLTNCTFTGNLAESTGGGIYNMNSNPPVTNCTFSGNSAGSEGGGMYNSGWDLTIRNCILWGNSAPSGPEIFNINSTPGVTYCDVAGGYAGTGNINADPLFIDANGLDGMPGTADDEEGYVHLRGYSPCINAGDPNGDYSGQVDIDGQPRVAYGRVDMGADEVFPAAGDYEPDGDVDFADFARMAQNWLLGAQ